MKKTVEVDIKKLFTPQRVWYGIICLLICCMFHILGSPVVYIKMTILIFAAAWATAKFFHHLFKDDDDGPVRYGASSDPDILDVEERLRLP